MNTFYMWALIGQSVKRLSTGWTVRGSKPGGARYFMSCNDLE